MMYICFFNGALGGYNHPIMGTEGDLTVSITIFWVEISLGVGGCVPEKVFSSFCLYWKGVFLL